MAKRLLFLAVAAICIYIPLHGQDTSHKHQREQTDKQMKYDIPASLKEEHKELHENLEKYTKLPGKTGAAAKEVAKMLHPHFVKEENFALPPLGLLIPLMKENATNEMKDAMRMADKLKTDWQEMLNEHQQILGSLVKLEKAAKEEHHPEVIRFTASLKLHARTEEEVLYPTAILVGEYLKLKLNQ
jgi:hypothetical protein